MPLGIDKCLFLFTCEAAAELLLKVQLFFCFFLTATRCPADCGVISTVHLNQLSIPGFISCFYIAANTITNSKHRPTSGCFWLESPNLS